MATSGAIAREAAATLATADVDRGRWASKPWEDVFTGLALARTAQGGGVATVGGVIVIGKLATVNIGWDVFHENWGFKLAPSTILMHLKTKDDKRIEEAHRWARRPR